MVQPYPSSGKPLTEAERPPAPPSVLNAVKLMYAGAIVSTASLIASLIYLIFYSGSAKSSIRKEFPHYTAGQINHAFLGFVILAIVSAGIGIGLWLWMAWANKRGKNWARITSTVLFVLQTLSLFSSLRGPRLAVGLVFPVLTWLVGAGAVWLLWQRESTAFFKRPDFV